MVNYGSEETPLNGITNYQDEETDNIGGEKEGMMHHSHTSLSHRRNWFLLIAVALVGYGSFVAGMSSVGTTTKVIISPSSADVAPFSTIKFDGTEGDKLAHQNPGKFYSIDGLEGGPPSLPLNKDGDLSAQSLSCFFIGGCDCRGCEGNKRMATLCTRCSTFRGCSTVPCCVYAMC